MPEKHNSQLIKTTEHDVIAKWWVSVVKPFNVKNNKNNLNADFNNAEIEQPFYLAGK